MHDMNFFFEKTIGGTMGLLRILVEDRKAISMAHLYPGGLRRGVAGSL